MVLLPLPLAVFIVFVLGLIIGSFLDVLISRFHTGKSINGRSRCMSCGHTLSWYELFPLVSYLALRGRCSVCGGKIPVRLFAMEVCTGLLFVYIYLQTSTVFELGFGLTLLSLLMVIAVYDIKHMIIPHEFVFVLAAMSILAVLYHMNFMFDLNTLFMHGLAATGAFAFYAGLWIISKGTWIGLGDAKLALPLGFMLSVSESFSMVVLSFWIGAITSICILGVQKILQGGKQHLPFIGAPLTMKSEVPFAPFVIVSFVLVYIHQVNVLAIMAAFF